jgi:tetratricopeptide (TPR) repeat protein
MQYTTSDVSQLLGLSPQQIRRFVRTGFIRPVRGARGGFLFSFQDLILLRTAAALRKANISSSRTLRTLRSLRQQLPSGRSLTEVRITVDGSDVVVHDGTTAWHPDSGQLLLDFTVSDLAAKAEPIAKKRFRLDPKHADAHVNLGRLLHEEGHTVEAATHYLQALRYDAGHTTAAFNLGVAMEDLGRVSEAMRAYQQCIAADSSFADAHYNLAAVLEKIGDQRGAIRHLTKYRRLSGTSGS